MIESSYLNWSVFGLWWIKFLPICIVLTCLSKWPFFEKTLPHSPHCAGLWICRFRWTCSICRLRVHVFAKIFEQCGHTTPSTPCAVRTCPLRSGKSWIKRNWLVIYTVMKILESKISEICYLAWCVPFEQMGHVLIALLASFKSSFNFFMTGDDDWWLGDVELPLNGSDLTWTELFPKARFFVAADFPDWLLTWDLSYRIQRFYLTYWGTKM